MIALPSLHLNTEYSFLESSIKIDDLINFAINNNLKSLVITDHNSMFGVAEFVHKCNKNNIKPIVGLDLDVEDFRLILLAKNYRGYQQLTILSSKKMKNNQINLEDINFENLFIIDHPRFGYFVKNNKLLKINNYFVGTNNETKYDIDIKKQVWLIETKILDFKDNRTIGILDAIKNNYNNINTFKFQPYFWKLDEKDLRVLLAQKIINECFIEFPNNDNFIPSYPIKENKQVFFKKLIEGQAKEKLKYVKNKKQYLLRIQYEFNIIKKLNFIDYFLIIWDLIKWAKENDIEVGPGRGSSSGSLIAYLLSITMVDPLKYDLFFERFLNPERVNMPDIDIDIQDSHRNKVINYLFTKYGYNHVCLISTFAKIGAKTALRDVARIYKISLNEIDYISKLISNNLSLEKAYDESLEFKQKIDSNPKYLNLFKDSQLIEGYVRQHGTHAAGVIISKESLSSTIPTINSLDNFNQTQFAMNYLEEYGLLKIDILGLKNLNIIQNIKKEIKNNQNLNIDWDNIDWNDKEVNKLLSSGKTNGIFQLESPGMKKTLQNVGVSSFDDLVAIIALFRPGPMKYIQTYSNVKHKLEKLELVTPIYDEIVNQTNGIIVFQEQIMQIVQKVSHLSFGQADILRRAISKKKESEINNFYNKFIDGAQKNGYSLELAKNIFQKIAKFANYGFNKSHAVSYAKVAYFLAFLKTKFSFEFYKIILDLHIGSISQIKIYYLEAKSKNIMVKSPEINISSTRIVSKDKIIFLPFTLIKGIGLVVAQKIINERKEKGEFTDFFSTISRLLKVVKLSETQVLTLIKSNVMRHFGNMKSLLKSWEMALSYAQIITIDKNDKLVLDYSLAEIKPQIINEKKDFDLEIINEMKFLGMSMNVFKTLNLENMNKIINLNQGEIKKLIVYVEDFKLKKDKNNHDMVEVIIIDSTQKVKAYIFSNVYQKMHSKIQKNIIVEVAIKKTSFNNITMYHIIEPWKVIKSE